MPPFPASTHLSLCIFYFSIPDCPRSPMLLLQEEASGFPTWSDSDTLSLVPFLEESLITLFRISAPQARLSLCRDVLHIGGALTVFKRLSPHGHPPDLAWVVILSSPCTHLPCSALPRTEMCRKKRGWTVNAVLHHLNN